MRFRMMVLFCVACFFAAHMSSRPAAIASTGAGVRSVLINATTINVTTQLRIEARSLALFNQGPDIVWVNVTRTAVAAASYGTNIPIQPNTWWFWQSSQGESVSQVGAITPTNPTNLLVYAATSPNGLRFLEEREACNAPDVGMDITIDNTAGGVEVVAANPKLCTALIYNHGAENIRCAFKNETPSSTLGILLKPEATWTLGIDDGVQLGINCIRTGVSNSTVSVHLGVRE